MLSRSQLLGGSGPPFGGAVYQQNVYDLDTRQGMFCSGLQALDEAAASGATLCTGVRE